MKQNDFFNPYHHWCFDALKAFEHQDEHRIDDIVDLYTEGMQQIYTFYLDQLSVGAEWSEHMAHVVEKMMGIKTIA